MMPFVEGLLSNAVGSLTILKNGCATPNVMIVVIGNKATNKY